MPEYKIEKVLEILNDEENLSICETQKLNKCMYESAGFNIFQLVSDKYYHENFHSDIIKVFLDKSGPHKEGSKYFIEFVNLLNIHRVKENKIPLDVNYFSNYSIEREINRIDITIKDDESKKAIIIENKINNANDTYRQLPTYLNEIQNNNYEVVAIVYLPMEIGKRPKTDGWTPDEKEKIEKLIIHLQAYDNNKDDLYTGWIQNCIKVATNEDSKMILIQYGKIILKLGGYMKDKEVLARLHSKLDEEGIQNALLLANLLEEYPSFIINKLYEIFNTDFKPKVNNNILTFEWFPFINADGTTINVKLVVECTREDLNFVCKLRLWERNYEENNVANVQQIISSCKIENKFIANDNSDELVMKYTYPNQFNDLQIFLNSFLFYLKTLVPNK